MAFQKIRRILPFLLCVFLTAGCVDAHAHITLRLDGSGVYELKVISTDLVISRFDNFKRRLEQSGYRLKTVDEGKRQGWIAVKEVDSFIQDPPGKEFRDVAESALGSWLYRTASAGEARQIAADGPKLRGADKPFKVEHGLFFTTITCDTDVDLTRLKRQDLFGLEQLLYDQMNLNFILTLPVKPAEHNATSVSVGGKTLIWKIRPGETNPIFLQVKLPNPVTWSLLILILVIAGIVAAVKAIRKRPKRGNLPPGGRWDTSPETFRWED